MPLTSEFKSKLARNLYRFFSSLASPFLWSLDSILACLVLIAPESSSFAKFILTSSARLVFSLIALILSFPFWLVSLPLLYVLYAFRAPYKYSYLGEGMQPPPPQLKSTYTLLTANLCLMSNFIARMNNLENINGRALKLGCVLAESQREKKVTVDGVNNPYNLRSRKKIPSRHHQPTEKATAPTRHDFLTLLPDNVDFICLQEVSDFIEGSASTVTDQLCQSHPYLVTNAGVKTWKHNCYMWDSGLAIASKHPFLDLDFQPFTHTTSLHRLSSTGLLMAKVDLGQSQEGHPVVGYVATTYMQSYPGDEQTHVKQLDEVLKWTKDFRQTTMRGGEIVAFDLFCGDFNFDSMSSGEKGAWGHRLFEVYQDVCRLKAGTDFDWTTGTEMRSQMLWEKEIGTAEGLKRVLLNPSRRGKYIFDADFDRAVTYTDIHGHRSRSASPSQDKATDGKRRIDVIVYRKEHPLAVTDYNFITALTTLTDHIPVSITFSPCSTTF